MPADRDAVAAILRKLSDSIRSLSASEWDAVVAGKFRVDITIGAAREARVESEDSEVPDSDLSELASLLREASTREAGHDLLAARSMSKESLVRFARYLDIPASKRDPNERIRDRIIEATIGFRLRSRAVQGEGRDSGQIPDTGSSQTIEAVDERVPSSTD
jgi:hypothetical protein